MNFLSQAASTLGLAGQQPAGGSSTMMSRLTGAMGLGQQAGMMQGTPEQEQQAQQAGYPSWSAMQKALGAGGAADQASQQSPAHASMLNNIMSFAKFLV